MNECFPKGYNFEASTYEYVTDNHIESPNIDYNKSKNKNIYNIYVKKGHLW